MNKSPIYVAVQMGHTAVIEALASLGADVSRADKSGTTQEFITTFKMHAAAADVLQRLGAAS